VFFDQWLVTCSYILTMAQGWPPFVRWRHRRKSDPVVGETSKEPSSQKSHCGHRTVGHSGASWPSKARHLVTGILPAAWRRCHNSGKRLYKEVSPPQFRGRTKRSRWVSPGSLAVFMAEQRMPAVLVVDDAHSFSETIREMLRPRGFAVFGARSAKEGMELFQAHKEQVHMAVIDLVNPAAGNLDLTSELERLHPGLPVLYLVGGDKTIARCSIEAQAPGSILMVPFTEEQLVDRIGGLMDVEVAARQARGKRRWDRFISAPDRRPLISGT
jgi:CheY-like chemotaxis protein